MNEYSLQSPFLYDFYTHTIQSKTCPKDAAEIEQLRNQLLQSQRSIQTHSFGASSKISKKSMRAVSNIARGGITEKKYASLLYRVIRRMRSENIVELGTSLGINTLYLSSDPKVSVTTFEGCTNTLTVAKDNFARMNRKNITCIEGNIDQTLDQFVSSQQKLDFVFFDANHQKEPTLKYFDTCLRKSHEKTVFVFDDIHWSTEMKKAWEEIKRNQVVTVTMDLFQVGLVFFDHHLTKEDFILSF